MSPDMAENARRSRFASQLPNRVSVVVALFVGWGLLKLLAAGLNAGSSTAFYIEWFAVLGGLFVVSGVLLYRRPQLGASLGLFSLVVGLLSNLYQLVVHSPLPSTIAGLIVVKLALAYVLITIFRDR
jgi:hypothetical protein